MKEITMKVISVIVLIFVLMITCIFSNQFDGVVFQQIGACAAIIGLILWIAGKNALGEYFTASFAPKGLVTKGIYSKIRHPMYTGGILIYLGIGLLFESMIGLVLTFVLITPLLICSAIEEERLLLEKYGKKYIRYKAQTII